LPLPLPTLPPRAVRAISTLAICAGALTAAVPAAALDLAVGPPAARGAYVWADVRLADLFEPRVAQSLSRGMPATLELRAELWRKRSGWFDRLESSYDAAVRVRYEVWNDWYRVERAGAPVRTYPSLDSLAATLSRPIALPVGRRVALQPEGRYYIAVSATLKPLSVEDVEEVEGWLSGEVENKRRAGFGVFTELPRSVFDAVRNFAGFGDHRARAQTEPFTPSALVESPAPH
jgi:Domain of unknown function (DUF4390)